MQSHGGAAPPQRPAAWLSACWGSCPGGGCSSTTGSVCCCGGGSCSGGGCCCATGSVCCCCGGGGCTRGDSSMAPAAAASSVASCCAAGDAAAVAVAKGVAATSTCGGRGAGTGHCCPAAVSPGPAWLPRRSPPLQAGISSGRGTKVGVRARNSAASSVGSQDGAGCRSTSRGPAGRPWPTAAAGAAWCCAGCLAGCTCAWLSACREGGRGGRPSCGVGARWGLPGAAAAAAGPQPSSCSSSSSAAASSPCSTSCSRSSYRAGRRWLRCGRRSEAPEAAGSACGQRTAARSAGRGGCPWLPVGGVSNQDSCSGGRGRAPGSAASCSGTTTPAASGVARPPWLPLPPPERPRRSARSWRISWLDSLRCSFCHSFEDGRRRFGGKVWSGCERHGKRWPLERRRQRRRRRRTEGRCPLAWWSSAAFSMPPQALRGNYGACSAACRSGGAVALSG